MTFEQADKTYLMLQQQLVLGTISPQEVAARVAAIRVQDAQGVVWQMNPADGSWLRSTEGAWGPGAPAPGAPVGPGVPPHVPSAQGPKSLLQLVGVLVKAYLRIALKLLPIVLIALPLIWLAHTFLVVWANEGTNPGVGGFYSYLLGLFRQPSTVGTATKGLVLATILSMSGGLLGGTLLWTLLGMLLSMTVMRLFQGRLGKSLGALARAPSWARKGFQRAGRSSAASLLGGASVALVLGDIIDNRIVSLQLMVLCIGALASQGTGILALALRLGRGDFRRLLGKAEQAEADPAWTTVFIVGLVVGFGATIVLLPWLGLLLGVPLLLLAVILGLVRGSGRPPAAALGVLLLTLLCVLLVAAPALADDGGWQEAGGTFWGWLTSEGAFVTILYGLPPALGFPIGLGNGAVVVIVGDDLLDGIPPGQLDQPPPEQPPAQDNLDRGDQPPPAEGEPGLGGPPSWDFPSVTGGSWENPFTRFDGGDGPGVCKIGAPNYWVSTATLQLMLEDELLAYGAFGPVVSIALSYASDSPEAGLVGRGWRLSFESRLTVQDDRILVRKGSGKLLLFRQARGPHPVQGPIEGETLDGTFNRLLDHGEAWEVIEKQSDLRYWFLKRGDGLEARLTHITDRTGTPVRLDYDDRGMLVAVLDAAGRATTFTYDHVGRCAAMRAPDGRTATLSYDQRGMLVRVADFAGLVTDYTYDADGGLVEMRVGRDRHVTRFTWQRTGAARCLATLTNAAGEDTRYELLSASPRVVGVTDAEGRRTVYESAGGLTTSVTSPSGAVSRTQFWRGLPVSVHSAKGTNVQFAYDGAGNPTRVSDSMGRVETSVYDLQDNLVSRTEPTGGVWQYAYDDRGCMVRATAPVGRTLAFEYDARGLLTAEVDPAGHRTTYAYDAHGNLTATTDPLGRTLRFAYDAAELQLASVTDPKGNTVRFERDGAGRVVRRTLPDGAFSVHMYDCCTGLATVDEAGREVSFTRDSMRRVLERNDELGGVTRFQFDRSGRMREQTDPTGRRTRIERDADGRVIAVVEPGGDTTRISLDVMGDVASITNPVGRTMSWERDAVGQATQFTDALGRRVSYRWDPSGRLAGQTNARGTQIDFPADPDGRMKAKVHGGSQVATYEYDASGNLATMLDAMGTTRYRYDAAGQHIGTQYPNGTNVSISYDALGLVETVNYPAGFVVQYARDSVGRLTTVRWGGHSIAFRYDAASRLLGEVRSNGTETSYVYPTPTQRTVEVSHVRGGVRFAWICTELDAAAQIVAEETALPMQAPCDASVSSTYDSADQLATYGGKRCTHDADGNLLEIEGGAWRASYDPENRLTRLERNGVVTEYAYDGRGQRVRITSGGAVRVLHHDELGRVMYETDKKGTVLRWNVWADGRLVAGVRPDGAVLFYHGDRLGSTLALTDASGQVQASFAYSPYGVTARSGPEANDPYTFVGALGVMDEGGDVYFMRTRFYAAWMGRFVQRDQKGVEGGVNLYAYVDNRPLSGVDPEGTFLFTTILVVSAIVTVGGGIAVGYAYKATHEQGKDLVEAGDYREKALKGMLRPDADDRLPGSRKPTATEIAHGARDRMGRSYDLTAKKGGKFAVKAYTEYVGAVPGMVGGGAPKAFGDAVKGVEATTNILTEGFKQACGAP